MTKEGVQGIVGVDSGNNQLLTTNINVGKALAPSSSNSTTGKFGSANTPQKIGGTTASSAAGSGAQSFRNNGAQPYPKNFELQRETRTGAAGNTAAARSLSSDPYSVFNPFQLEDDQSPINRNQPTSNYTKGKPPLKEQQKNLGAPQMHPQGGLPLSRASQTDSATKKGSRNNNNSNNQGQQQQQQTPQSVTAQQQENYFANANNVFAAGAVQPMSVFGNAGQYVAQQALQPNTSSPGQAPYMLMMAPYPMYGAGAGGAPIAMMPAGQGQNPFQPYPPYMFAQVAQPMPYPPPPNNIAAQTAQNFQEIEEEQDKQRANTNQKSYTAYTLKEYQNIKKMQNFNYSRGLGPNLSEEEWKRQRDKRERMEEFAQQVKQFNHMNLQGGASGHTHHKKEDSQSLAAKQAAAKRDKAIEFAKHIPKPKQKPVEIVVAKKPEGRGQGAENQRNNYYNQAEQDEASDYPQYNDNDEIAKLERMHNEYLTKIKNLN